MIVDHESRKAAQELADFRSFVNASDLAIFPGSVRNGNANLGEPDIICVLDGQTTGFELTAACAPEFAAASTEAYRSDSGVSVSFGEDASAHTLRKKLAKTYAVAPVHLLIYRGFTALTDEMIIDLLKPELMRGLGPFNKIWFHGDNVHLLEVADS